jgi:hypothetical protein
MRVDGGRAVEQADGRWGAGDRARPLDFYLPPSSFPADRSRLVGDARRASAPDPIVQALVSLPIGAIYSNLIQLSGALRGGDQRGSAG